MLSHSHLVSCCIQPLMSLVFTVLCHVPFPFLDAERHVLCRLALAIVLDKCVPFRTKYLRLPCYLRTYNTPNRLKQTVRSSKELRPRQFCKPGFLKLTHGVIILPRHLSSNIGNDLLIRHIFHLLYNMQLALSFPNLSIIDALRSSRPMHSLL
ncbi:hypothetical protein M758_UG111300 [Ceratodon purpureus]|nr:hypothetical protein M758_UG111300 [Ceratodon purpureus]